MSKKTITIFITTFIIVGILILGVYFWFNKKNTNTNTPTPWYQSFNPFGTGSVVTNPTQEPGATENPTQEPGANTQTSKFYKLTDFAVAGATFFNDKRLIIKEPGVDTTPQPTEIKTIISPNTKEGRKDIQTFLNTTLSLKPPLTVDGNFGKKVTEAIKSFQKLNNLTVTGKIDTETAPFFTKTTSSATLLDTNQYEQVPTVRYIKRMDGHMFKMFLDTKMQEEVSNSTIPSIYEAFFNELADTVVYRYLSEDNTISTFIASLGAPKGEFLPQGISDFSVSKDGTKYFYLSENSNGATGVIGTFSDTKKDYVFNSPFTEWLSQWTNNQKIFLTTKASSGVDGSIFLLDTTNKTTSKILGGISGLTTLVSPNGSNVLYSTSTETGPKLGVFNINKHETKDLSTYGLPEKCIWSNDNINVYCGVPNTITGNQYPDMWYQGLISFDDYFIKINTQTGDMVTIANSKDETLVDGTYLFLNNKEDTLFFVNKKDSTLWSLSLN